MKLKPILIAFAALVVFAACQSNSVSKSVTLTNDIDSASYALGVLIGQNNKQSLDATPGAENIDLDIMVNAFLGQMKAEEEPQIDATSALTIIQEFFQKATDGVALENAAEGEAFLADNKLKDGVQTTESGIQYEIIVEGAGAKPSAESTVTCHYTGTLIDGTVFDSSVERGEPASFKLNQVIPGWTEALQLMPVGSKWKIYIPSELGYGENGAGADIGPNSALIFEIELLDIAD